MAFGKYAVDYEQRIDYDRLRRERLQRAKDQIGKTELGAILSWDAATIRYLTSYYDPTCMRASETQSVFLPRDGEPILFCTDTPSETERRMPWLKGRVRPSLPSLKLTAKTANDFTALILVDIVARLLAEHGVEKRPLGIDGSVFGITISEAFRNAGIATVNATPVLDEARQIKTRDEIELMRISCANTESAFAAIVDAIRPGIREVDLVAIGIKALYEEGVDHTENLVCCSGYNTNPYRWSFSDKPIRPGDLIYIDVTGASYQGYVPCVYRTFCCGKATSKQRELYDECRTMLYDAIEVVKHGATDYDIYEKWPDSPEYWGYSSWHECAPFAFGHGLGLTLHDQPVISPLKKLSGQPPQELKAGMTIALETYAGRKGEKDGVRLEETLLVTESGREVLSRWPIDELMECWPRR
jgi:Xaa-Pro aminopeptidase